MCEMNKNEIISCVACLMCVQVVRERSDDQVISPPVSPGEAWRGADWASVHCGHLDWDGKDGVSPGKPAYAKLYPLTL